MIIPLLEERAGVRTSVKSKFQVCVVDRPHLNPLPRGEDFTHHAFWFANDRTANPVAGFSVRRRKILLLLREKAGLREDVKQTYLISFGVDQPKVFLRVRSLDAAEICAWPLPTLNAH